MTLPLICSTDIDWSATGAWFAGFATWAGVFLAAFAMNTWKNQIRLQDRYQKADALLQSFIICIRAGVSWHWDCGVGKARKPLENSEGYPKWQSALMDYRLTWDLAHPLFDDNENRGLSVHPETLQSAIIEAGTKFLPNEKTSDFFARIEEIQSSGTKEIIKRRNSDK